MKTAPTWRLIVALVVLTGSTRCLRCEESRVSGGTAGVKFNCNSRNINRLPVDLPRHVTQLHLDHNAIVVIPEGAFRNMQHLVLLDLSFNKINTLNANCFIGLGHVRKLNLHGNFLELARLPKQSFEGLSSLLVLAIAQQVSTGEYPVSILDSLQQLRTLSVAGEDTHLPAVYGQLPRLSTLVLTGGDVTTVSTHTFSAIKTSNITTLMIRRGNLTHIEAGAFTDFTNLRVLDLSCNSKLNFRRAIQSLGQTFNSSIDTVLLDQTHPGVYGVLDFRDFCSESLFWKSIRRLSLRDVHMKMLVVQGMLCVAGIEELYLSHNPVVGVSPSTSRIKQQLQQLSKLRVADVSYTGNGNLAAARCSGGHELDFDVDNYLPSYPRLPSVYADIAKSVQPSEDVKCVNMRINHIVLPPRLQYVDASHLRIVGRNNLKDSCTVVSADNDARFLNLSGTAFVRHLHSFLIGLTKLQVIDCSHGMLESFGKDAFKHMPSLLVLNVSHNALGKGQTLFDKVFSFSRQLEIIDLSNNGFHHIHRNTFSKCTQLKEIKLANNLLNDVHLQIEELISLNLIDLSGNLLPVLSSDFMKELDNLNTKTQFRLNVNSNEFVCDCSGLTFIRWMLTADLNVIERTNLTCLYKGSHTRISAISLSDLQNGCDTYMSLKWAIPLVVLIVILTLLAMYLFRDFMRFQIYIWRNSRVFSTRPVIRPLRRYHVTVLFDEYDTEFRDWALNELNEKLLEWRLEAYFMIRDEFELDGIQNGSPLENIAVAINQSDKLIVCLTKDLLRDREFQQQLRFAGYSNKRKDDYMFISRGDVPVPEIVSCRVRPWQRPSSRLDLDEHDADTCWGILRDFLVQPIKNRPFRMLYRQLSQNAG